MDRKLKKWELSMLTAMCLTLLLSAWAEGRQEDYYSSLVRVHIIADSDSAEEQAAKLAVRDAVLTKLEPLLRECKTADAAAELLSASLEDIGIEALAAAGGRAVSVQLGDVYYPTRHADGFSLPAGKYRSLRVTLNSGEGHNWWGLVFPVPVEKKEPPADGEGISLVTDADGYNIKFKIVELWGRAVELICGG